MQRPELRALSTEALSAVWPEALARRVRAVLQVNVLRELSSCPVPVLYLRGERGFHRAPEHNVREIVSARPSVQVVRMPAPHLVLHDQPKAAAAAIMEFVGKVEAAR